MSQLKHKQRSVEDISKLPIVGKKPKTEKEEKFLREVCEYEFINVEERGATHRFSYGNASNQHVFTFDHGKKYKLPRFIAEHVESRQTNQCVNDASNCCHISEDGSNKIKIKESD